jgi:uncharacterized protein involved in high-affinity Fe2+ transport
MNKIQSFCIVFLFTALTGCASMRHIPLAPEHAKAIKSLSIDSEIKKPEAMYEVANGSQYGALFGLAGGVASAINDHIEAKNTKQFAENHHVDIQKIVYQQWVKQFKENRKFKLSSGHSDAKLETEIVLYGISIPNGFSSDYVPVLTLSAKLHRNNAVVWQYDDFVSPLADGMPRFQMNAILNDPHKLELMWDRAAERIIQKMILDMEKSK